MNEFKYWNSKTKKGLTEDEYNNLSDKEKKDCTTYKRKPGKPGDPKRQDYDWYNVNDAVSEAVGNIPFNIFPGTYEDLELTSNWNPDTITMIRTAMDNSTPGLLKINYIPTYGKADSSVAAINVAARSTYTWVRHQNSGRTNYEAPDLMLYIMAMDQIYTAWFEGKRIYDAAMTYSYVNRYIPDTILAALDVNAADVRNKLADLRYGLNLLAAKISSMAVPSKFSIYKRHAILANNVFYDSTSERGQMYLFASPGIMTFSSTTEGGGSLSLTKYSAAADGKRTVETILNDINAALEIVLQDEDMNIMSGDILKAYGRENLFTLDFIAEEETLKLVLNEDVLQQIENSTTAWPGVPKGQVTYSITQGDAQLVTNEPKPASNSVVFNPTKHQYFNSHKDVVTYKDVIEWSRCTCTDTYGTEYIISYQIYTMSGDEGNRFIQEGAELFTGSRLFGVLKSGSGSDSLYESQQFMMLSIFDWHPILYPYFSITTTSGTAYYALGKFGDLKKYTFITPDNIKRLHDAAVMGALNSLSMSAK